MHVITQARLREFGKEHPDADGPLRAWETIVRARKYRSLHEIREDFRSVDFLRNGKAVFDIGGNKYWLVAKILYRSRQVLIRHVVTHRDYDRLNKLGLI